MTPWPVEGTVSDTKAVGTSHRHQALRLGHCFLRVLNIEAFHTFVHRLHLNT